LADKLERELINGVGTAGTIGGLVSIASAHVATGAAADRIGHAGAALAALGWLPSLVILNPADWFAIASERGTDGYIASGGWNLPPSPNLWAMDVVVSSAQTAGTALVLDAAQVAILDRQQASVDIGYVNDQFVKNMLTIRAELRAALAIYSPSALVKVALA
jgi:HK97 family phage major capsid protein